MRMLELVLLRGAYTALSLPHEVLVAGVPMAWVYFDNVYMHEVVLVVTPTSPKLQTSPKHPLHGPLRAMYMLKYHYSSNCNTVSSNDIS